MRTLKPIRGRVIIKRIKKNVTQGGLMLPDNREQETVEGEVIAIGPGVRTLMTGECVTSEIEVGDIVLYWANEASLIPLEFEGEKFDAISDEQSIIAKIKGEKDEPNNSNGKLNEGA